MLHLCMSLRPPARTVVARLVFSPSTPLYTLKVRLPLLVPSMVRIGVSPLRASGLLLEILPYLVVRTAVLVGTLKLVVPVTNRGDPFGIMEPSMGPMLELVA